MSDILAAIADDEDKYVENCRIFKEEVQRGAYGHPECYGAHALDLQKRRFREEREAFRRLHPEAA